MEATKSNSLKRIILTGTGFLILSGSLARLFIHAKMLQPEKSLLMAGFAWVSYMTIHWSETGKFIDPRKDEKHLPEDERNWLHLAVSAVLFAFGMTYGAVGVSNGNFPQAFLGAATLLTGYFIAHFEFSDHIV